MSVVHLPLVSFQLHSEGLGPRLSAGPEALRSWRRERLHLVCRPPAGGLPQASSRRRCARIRASAVDIDDDGQDLTDSNGTQPSTSMGTQAGTSRARMRRLEKLREEKAKKVEEYPDWARVLEDAVNDDKELGEILGDSIGNPEEMKRKIYDRLQRKGPDVLSPKSGSATPMQVAFRGDRDPLEFHIWMELYSKPTTEQMEVLAAVFRAWYLMGKLGAFNSLNLQLNSLPVDAAPKYSQSHAEAALDAYFHNIGDLEFQDNWGRVWVDFGCSDMLSWDILINSLSTISSDKVGIKQIIFGGSKLGDWEEGMTSEADGYQVAKI